MKITPVLWTYHKTKSGLYPVKIRRSHAVGGKTKVTYTDTGIKIEKRQWAGVVKNHPKALEYNARIVSMCQEDVSSGDLLDYFREYMNRPTGYYHKKKLANVYRIISELSPEPTLRFLYRLEKKLSDEKKHPNYIADVLGRVRTVIKIMCQAGALDYNKNPFHHFKIKMVKTERKRLSLEQIQALIAANLDKRERLAVDMYATSFYQGGIRFGDLCRIRPENVRPPRLCYTMNKSKKERNLPLHKIAAQILKKYSCQFPLNINWQEESRSIGAKNALMNKFLKRACLKAGIPPVSFHTSRNSVADRAVRLGKSTAQIKGILGHDRISTTEAYLKSFYPEETDSALESLF